MQSPNHLYQRSHWNPQNQLATIKDNLEQILIEDPNPHLLWVILNPSQPLFMRACVDLQLFKDDSKVDQLTVQTLASNILCLEQTDPPSTYVTNMAMFYSRCLQAFI